MAHLNGENTNLTCKDHGITYRSINYNTFNHENTRIMENIVNHMLMVIIIINLEYLSYYHESY